ncbi:hypothetical protein HKD37_08G021057 [Glycine soja]
MMSRIAGEKITFLCFDSILNEINCFELPPHKLDLKVEVHVMLLRNIDQSNGLYNDTRLQVRRMEKHVIQYQILNGKKVDDIVFIPQMRMRMIMIPCNQMLPIKFQQRQFLMLSHLQ